MRVRVEEALGQDLPVVGLQELARCLLALGSLGRLANRDPLDLLHHEQPGGAQIPEHLWHVEPVVLREHRAHPVDAARLLPEVELALQRL